MQEVVREKFFVGEQPSVLPLPDDVGRTGGHLWYTIRAQRTRGSY